MTRYAHVVPINADKAVEAARLANTIPIKKSAMARESIPALLVNALSSALSSKRARRMWSSASILAWLKVLRSRATSPSSDSMYSSPANAVAAVAVAVAVDLDVDVVPGVE